MKKFQNILFVSQGITDETNAIDQALSIAQNNKVGLTVMIVCPELSGQMNNYRDKFEAMLKGQLQKSIQASRERVKINENEVPVEIQLESGSIPAVRIIRHVLQQDYDLVIKEIDPQESTKGFRAVDMELLRKCPCPVWLCRPINQHREQIEVAVAIDPEAATPENRDLALRLLTLSRSIADTCNGELNIVSCWDYEFEEFLRRNVWTNMSDSEISEVVMTTQNKHRADLDELVAASHIGGKIQIHHLRGEAQKVIPKWVEDKKIAILVMGTVGRTGIPGVLIGNTAENIAQKLTCSLLALKPNGFISPVRAYS